MTSGSTPPSAVTQNAPAQSSSVAEAASATRARYALIVVLAGLGVVLAAFAVSVAVFHNKAGDVSTVLAPVTGVIGTVVGAYFGVQVGSQGKEQADANAASAHDKAMRLAAVSDPDRAAAALGFRLEREGGGDVTAPASRAPTQSPETQGPSVSR